MDALMHKSNLELTPRNTDDHSLSGGSRKVAFGRGVEINFKKEPELTSFTQFLNKHDLRERTDPQVGLKPLGQGAFGVVTVICQRDSNDSLCVMKTPKGMGAPQAPDRIEESIEKEVRKEVRKEVDKKLNDEIVEKSLGDTELNAFMLPVHDNICRSHCALIKYDNEKTLELITSRSDIEQSRGEYKVKAIFAENCGGTELQNRLTSRSSNKPISNEIVSDIALKVMKALHCIHQSGFAYRDLKPANILYNPETGELKIIDFGLTRKIPETKEFISGAVGTPGFIAPEEYGRREVSVQGDDWSLGATLLSILFNGEWPDNLMAEMLQKNSPEDLTDCQCVASEFSSLADDSKRKKINKAIKKIGGDYNSYSELVDIIIELTRFNRTDRMSTKSAMDKLQKLFDQGKVRYPEHLSEDAFNGIEPFEEFSQEELDAISVDIPLFSEPKPSAKGWGLGWLGLR